MALYAAGVSQRKAAEVMSLLLGRRYTHETISAITDQVLEAAEAFRMRALPAAFPQGNNQESWPLSTWMASS